MTFTSSPLPFLSCLHIFPSLSFTVSLPLPQTIEFLFLITPHSPWPGYQSPYSPFLPSSPFFALSFRSSHLTSSRFISSCSCFSFFLPLFLSFLSDFVLFSPFLPSCSVFDASFKRPGGKGCNFRRDLEGLGVYRCIVAPLG